MKLNAYSIYDEKALQYHAPFFMVSDGAAVRALSDLANDQNTNIGRHPGDYKLYCIGIFDDANGGLASHSPPLHVVDAVSLIEHKTADLFTSSPASAAKA